MSRGYRLVIVLEIKKKNDDNKDKKKTKHKRI